MYMFVTPFLFLLILFRAPPRAIIFHIFAGTPFSPQFLFTRLFPPCSGIIRSITLRKQMYILVVFYASTSRHALLAGWERVSVERERRDLSKYSLIIVHTFRGGWVCLSEKYYLKTILSTVNIPTTFCFTIVSSLFKLLCNLVCLREEIFLQPI